MIINEIIEDNEIIEKRSTQFNDRRLAIAKDIEKDSQVDSEKKVENTENGRSSLQKKSRHKQESRVCKLCDKEMRVKTTQKIKVSLINIDQSAFKGGELGSILMIINLVVHLSVASIWSFLISIFCIKKSSIVASKLINSFDSHPWKRNLSVNKIPFSLVRSS